MTHRRRAEPGKRALVTGAAGGLGREVALQLAARGCRVGDLPTSTPPGWPRPPRSSTGPAPSAESIVGDLTAGRRAGGGRRSGGGALGRHRYSRQQCRLRRDRAVPRGDRRGLDPDPGAQRHGAGDGLQGRRPGHARASARAASSTSPRRARAWRCPNYTAYTASKAGVDAITRAAAVALAPYGVLVNSLAPGMMDTEMQRSTEADLARVDGRDDLQAFLDERTRRVPLGRRAEIAEVAAARRLAGARRARLHDRRAAQHVAAASTRTDAMLRNAPRPTARRHPRAPQAPRHGRCAATC